MENLTKEEKKVITEFSERNNFSPSLLTKLDICAIHNIEYSFSTLRLDESDYFDNLQNEPIWGFSSVMIDRLHNYISGSLVAYITGNYQVGEIVSRTATESSLGIIYILSADDISKLHAYLSNYIDKERKRIREWRKLLNDLPTNERETHERSIKQKETALEVQECFIKNHSEEMKSSLEEPTNWQNIFNLFKETNKEIDYRTIYGMMCSQVHSDAGDILNRYVILSSIENGAPREFRDKLVNEEKMFSYFMIHISISYFIEALISYADRFNLNGAKKDLSEILEWQKVNVQYIAQEMEGLNN